MRIIRGEVSTDIVGSEYTFEFEVDDDATEDEIEEAAWDAAQNYIYVTYEESSNDEE